MAGPAAAEQLAGHRQLRFIPAGVCCALAIAACGGSSNPSVGGGGRSGSLVSFAVCMRSHGVPNLPDPGSGGGGGGVSIVPAGINKSSPAFKTAWSTCAKLLLGMGAHHRELVSPGINILLPFPAKCTQAHLQVSSAGPPPGCFCPPGSGPRKGRTTARPFISARE